MGVSMSDIVEAIENCIGTNAVLKGDAVREKDIGLGD